MKKILLTCTLLLFFCPEIFSQFSEGALEYSIPLERSLLQRYEEALSSKDVSFHTAFRPWTAMELRKAIPFDSLNTFPLKDNSFNKTWFGRKLRNEHLFTVDEPDFRLTVDPLFDFNVSRETEREENLYVNTRGARILGNLTDEISFYTGFYETQAKFPHYLDVFIVTFGIVPGQGKVKNIKGTFDYAMAFGGVTFTPSKYFNVQLAHDKNFIGDGYRSLLLSDNSFNYPFLKLTANVWRLKYSVLYAQFMDLLSPHDPDIGYRKKYGTFHYLDIKIGRRLYFGFFEGVIWKSDSLGSRNFEINYLNPVIFLRPVEASLDSPDNIMLGSNLRFKISDRTSFYGQLLLDEFKLNEIKAGKGWWGNKHAFQAGLKTFSVAGIKNLNLQGELNFVRPFTYQHRSTLQNYAHYNQALAHPLGANFIEEVFLADYRFKRCYAAAKVVIAKIGWDMNGENYGNNIFRDYFSYRSVYGNEILQGLKTDFLYYELKTGYLVNPAYNFNVEIGIASRQLKNTLVDEKAMLFTFGIRTALFNKYYDF